MLLAAFLGGIGLAAAGGELRLAAALPRGHYALELAEPPFGKPTALRRCTRFALSALLHRHHAEARGAAAEAPPTDYRDWSAANSAAYVPLLQATTPDCKGRPIRTCGHVVVDVGELTHAVVSLIQGLDAAGPPPQTVRT